MSKFRFGVSATALLLFGLAATTHAQNTISVPIVTLYAAGGMGQGGGTPHLSFYDGDPDPAPYIRHLDDFQPGAWAEYIVSTTTPGLYTVSMEASDPSDDHTVFSIETRPRTGTDDPYATRFASQDSMDYGRFGSFNPRSYVAIDPLKDPAGASLTVPLFAGDNVLRIYNTTGRHNPSSVYPVDLKSTTDRPSGFPWSNLQILTITLNRVGELPSLGTITGTVTGDQPAGIPVRNALVTANPAGQSPAEISNFWKWGWYTMSRADGTYTLKAPVGSQEVKAGRPSSYQISNTTPIQTVTVPATGSVTADFGLKSIFFQDAASGNAWTAYIQTEYLDSKSGTLALVPVDGPPENTYKVGWVDGGDTASMIIDVPQAGNYEVTSAYTNGGGEGTYRVFTDFGPYTEDKQPNSGGWNVLAYKTYANPIYLAQGTQVLSIRNNGGASDFDAIHLKRLDTPVTVGTLEGTVTNTYGGAPLANATITVAGQTVTTDANGHYKMYVNGATSLTVTASHPNQEAAASAITDVTANATTTLNLSIGIRPVVSLATTNGYSWKYLANTGGTADYSGATADESAFQPIIVPSDVTLVAPTHDIYIWYRMHFTVPQNFLTAFPDRMVRLRVSNIDDVDKTWLNGTPIGQTGQFPTTPLAAQTDLSYRNPSVPNTPATVYPGLNIAYGVQRLYTFPASLLKPGDNVLAFKVFQLNGGGGITGTPYLEIAPPAGGITGKVLVGGTGQAGIRVAAMDASGLTSDWTLTGADGSYTLTHATPGFTVVGAAKPGIAAVSVTTSVTANATTSDVNLTTATIPDGPAPLYDDFNDGPEGWKAKWDAVSLDPNDPTKYPKIYEPGYDAFDVPISTSSTPIPSTISIESTTGGQRGGLLSKARFSKYASVSSARLVSAIPATPVGTGNMPNVIFRIIGDPAADDPSKAGTGDYVEIDIEGYLNIMNDSNFPEQRVRYMVWSSAFGNPTWGALDDPTIYSLSDVSTTNPIDYTIVRLGSFLEFYLNGKLIHSQNMPGTLTDNHKLFPYSFSDADFTTWDWAKAGPVAYSIALKGDLNGNGKVDTADAARALRLAGGLDSATADDIAKGDVVTGAGINLLDALRIAQAAAGKAL